MNLHPEAAAFLRAIAANPDDDTPRLVFADWLEEHGEPERAEFVRCPHNHLHRRKQCTANRCRSTERSKRCRLVFRCTPPRNHQSENRAHNAVTAVPPKSAKWVSNYTARRSLPHALQ